VFDPQHVYTFVICQSIMDMPAYRLKLGAFINLDLCPVLNGQPLQLMCKNVQVRSLKQPMVSRHEMAWIETCCRAVRGSRSPAYTAAVAP
jgi:hypothetical protein